MKLSLKKVSVVEIERRHAAWTFARSTVKGDEIRYDVRDRNYHAGSKWEFVVRRPKKKTKYIEVRPIRVPNIKAFAQLSKRVITFRRATLAPNTGKYYCKVTIADRTGGQTKKSLSVSEWRFLPWSKELKGHIWKKADIRTTKGKDGDALVVLVGRDDDEAMIKAFFVLKVWVLRERFNPYSLKIQE